MLDPRQVSGKGNRWLMSVRCGCGGEVTEGRGRFGGGVQVGGEVTEGRGLFGVWGRGNRETGCVGKR